MLRVWEGEGEGEVMGLYGWNLLAGTDGAGTTAGRAGEEQKEAIHTMHLDMRVRVVHGAARFR